MEYANRRIGFVVDAPEVAPVPVINPAPSYREEILADRLINSVVYAAVLEREVLALRADAEGKPFYLN